MEPQFVTAYSKSTGRKHRVPKHFIGHPKLGRDLELAPSQRAAEAAADALAAGQEVPDDSWTREQLKAYAAENLIDLGDASLKADILAAVTADPNTSDANQATDETPATGADEGAQ